MSKGISVDLGNGPRDWPLTRAIVVADIAKAADLANADLERTGKYRGAYLGTRLQDQVRKLPSARDLQGYRAALVAAAGSALALIETVDAEIAAEFDQRVPAHIEDGDGAQREGMRA